MIENKKSYDPNNNIWFDIFGQIFIKNEFIQATPIFINITSQTWIWKPAESSYINWNELSLPYNIELAFKEAIKKKLKTVSSGYLLKCRLMLKEFKQQINPNYHDLSEIKIEDIYVIWHNMTTSYRPFFRELYTNLANKKTFGASYSIATRMKTLNARNNVRTLKDVLNWHPTKGALTREEEIILCNSIESNHYESPHKLGIRLFCWLLIATLKRSKQIRELQPNDFKKIETNKVEEYFVHITPVKNQTGDPKSWWPIPKSLYFEIQRYSSIPSIKLLQKKHNRFWVMNCPSLHQNNIVDAAYGKTALQRHIKKDLKLISPRTKQLLHITPTRIRHTGATRLAYSGISRDIIAEILEHDNPSSCNAYIDAIGSELCPSINRADRNMNSLFMKLNEAYFKGKIVNKLTNTTIIIPDLSASSPIFVGSCGRDTLKEDLCNKHPFIDCYNGCSHFLAWKEADHYRALIFANNELERWSKAHGHTKQIPTIKEYKILKENILKVINCIKNIEKASS